MEKSRDRSKLPVEYTWSTDDIYTSVDEWEKDFGLLSGLLSEIKNFIGHIDNTDTLKNCLVMLDELHQRLDRLTAYAYLRYHTDLTNPAAQSLVSRIDEMMVNYHEATAFIEPEILTRSPAQLTAFLEAKELGFYRFSLEKKIRKKPHILSREQEEILAKAGMLAQVPENVFSLLNDADLKFPEILDERNNLIELTHARYGKCLESTDRRVRANAFQAYHASYKKQQHTITGLFNGNIQKDLFYHRTLHYPSSLSMALFDDNIPDQVYENLIRTVERQLPVFHRYLKLRKKCLGVEELHLYDLSVPLVPEITLRFSYEEARSVILRALTPLGDEYSRLVAKAFEGRWIDVYENDGKHSGGYNWGVYGVHPYILLNFEGTLGDVFTIAHEIGHAIHSYLSNQSQEYHYASYSIFIAEIASTLNEALLLHHLLDTAQDIRTRLYYLSYFVNNFRATVIVQTMFAEFEKIVHELAEHSQPLTLESLNHIYHSLHQKYYGGELTIDPEAEIGWMRIPHFYQSFYVFKYATGFSAAQYLSTKILKSHNSFIERYHDLLRSGGNNYPLELLRTAGVDMSLPDPIEQAFKNFEEVLSELERLL